MTDKQPDPLRVADELDCHNARLDRQAAKVIRTQHAAIERKDALLRRALEVMYEVPMHTSASTWSPSLTNELKELCLAINSEISQ